MTQIMPLYTLAVSTHICPHLFIFVVVLATLISWYSSSLSISQSYCQYFLSSWCPSTFNYHYSLWRPFHNSLSYHYLLFVNSCVFFSHNFHKFHILLRDLFFFFFDSSLIANKIFSQTWQGMGSICRTILCFFYSNLKSFLWHKLHFTVSILRFSFIHVIINLLSISIYFATIIAPDL